MSYGVGWGGTPWGDGATLSEVVPVTYDVEIDDVIAATSDVFIGLQQIPTIIAGAQSPTRVEVVFSVAMSVDSNFLSGASYTITAATGSTYIPVLSVTPSGPLPLRRAILELGIPLDSKQYYFLTVALSVVSLTGDPADPNFTEFQWMDMTASVFVRPLVIPIKDFSGEVRGGLLGNPDGQIFFSPAYEDVDSTSTIELEQLSVCTKAYDEYHLPDPPDPVPLLTWGPGISSVIGPGSALWAPFDRMGLPRMDLEVLSADDFQPAYDFNLQATLVETIDITKGGFMNDLRWGTFPATGKTVFTTAANQSPIGPGPTTQLKLDWPKIYLDDSVSTTDQIVLNAIDLEMQDSVVIDDSLIVQNITVGFISITIDESMAIADSAIAGAQYVRVLATDTVTVSDSVSVTKTLSVTASDTISLTDTSSAEIPGTTLDVIASDSASATDALSFQVDKGVADTVSIVDSLLASSDYIRTGADTISLTDSIVAESSGSVVDVLASDSVSVTDENATVTDYTRPLADSVSLTDSTTVQPFYLFSVILSDSISLTDSESNQVDTTGGDSLTVTDAAATSFEYGRSSNDTADLTDSLTASTDYIRSLSDTIDVTDTAAGSLVNGEVIVNETAITVTDSNSIEVSKGVSDSVTVTDSNSMEVSKGVSDTVAPEDLVWTGAAVQYHDTTHSPVGLWQFNESLADTSGNGFTLTVETGAVTYGDIFPGVKGVNLDGTTTLVYNTSTATLGRTGDITVEMLLNLSAYTTTKFLISYAGNGSGGSAANALYLIEMLNSSTEFTVMQENSSNAASRTSTFTNRPPLNTLCHFAMTRISNVIRIYLNGVLVETSSALTTPTGGSSSVFRVGAASNRGTAPACSIASLKVVASGLTGSQVTAEYNRTLGRFYGEI